LLTLFIISQTLYLHRVPGLLGDEGSEGENVYQIIDTKKITVTGERSYIGPLIDYVRIPFVLTFGYNALSLRLIILLANAAAFLLSASISKKYFGQTLGHYILTGVFFSPAFLLYQRLGWAISLIPFFVSLLLFLATRTNPHKYLAIGVVAGIALSNHIIFLSALIPLAIVGLAATLKSHNKKSMWLHTAIGFWAAFAMQLAVLMLQNGDQGQPLEVASLYLNRLKTLPETLAYLVSGSSYSAIYTGMSFSGFWIVIISTLVTCGISGALILPGHRKKVAIWLASICLHLAILLIMIDRFSLRYFVVSVASLWGISVFGYGKILQRFSSRLPWLLAYAPSALAVVMIFAALKLTLIPFLSTGGSLKRIPLNHDRSEPASAFVALENLISCLPKNEKVFSEDIHIFNRLQFLSHGSTRIKVSEQPEDALWIVAYADSQTTLSPPIPCSDLQHFTITPPSTSAP
jgi:hypothetical protein